MLKNYLNVAIRNLIRNKTFTAINVTGLAVGLAVFLLIFEYVAFEWNSNRFHKNFNGLYRLGTTDNNGNHGFYLAPGFASAITQKIPSITSFVRVTDDLGSGVISYNDEKTGQLKSFREENIVYADSNYLQVFSFPVISGSSSLGEPKTMALSETMARTFFGSSDVAGKNVTISNQFGDTPYKIVAVFKDPPPQSDLKPSLLLSLATLQNAANRNDNGWADPATLDNSFVNCYVTLKKEGDAKKVAGMITSLVHSIKPETAHQSFLLQPFRDMHLAPNFSYPYQTFGSLKLVSMLLAIGLLILLIAWINYINLSTVQALRRAKETGVRKVLGATRAQLSVQYLTETLLLTCISVAICCIMVQLFQHLFNEFTGKELSLHILNSSWFWLAAVAIILSGSLFSGSYVAFVQSSFKPVTAIKGKVAGTGSISLRKGLVISQFTISIVFIIATIVMFRQLQFMKSSTLGVTLSQLLVIKGPTVSSEGQAEKNVAFKNGLGQLPFVKKYAASNNVPGRGYNFSADGITRLSPQKGDEKKSYRMFISDDRFFDTYGIQFAEGRAFSQEDANRAWMNSKKILINEKAARQLGFAKGEIITGQKIVWAGTQYEISGVVKDYHHLSLQNAIEPIVFLPSVSFYYFTIQTEASNLQAKIATLTKMYRDYFPGNPFEYFFADETFNKQYQSEQRISNLFIGAAVIAIIIACMGLFGLAAFTSQQRTKEIGIRKVLGASVVQVAGLLSKDFLWLVMISILIASPLAWWAMNRWLLDFEYRTSIGWWIFAMAGCTALLIAILTVSVQAVRAARANPVKSLRTE